MWWAYWSFLFQKISYIEGLLSTKCPYICVSIYYMCVHVQKKYRVMCRNIYMCYKKIKLKKYSAPWVYFIIAALPLLFLPCSPFCCSIVIYKTPSKSLSSANKEKKFKVYPIRIIYVYFFSPLSIMSMSGWSGFEE